MNVFVILIPWLAAVLGEPSMNKIYTFLSDMEVSWNMANQICSEVGMSIASPFTQRDFQELFQFSKSALWNMEKKWDGRGSQKMWTGAHSSLSGTLFWPTCRIFDPSLNPWLDIQSNDDNKCLLVEVKETPKWAFEGCDRPKKVICEASAGPCVFVPQMDTVLDSFVQQHFVDSTNESCQESCLLNTQEGVACQAYIFHDANNTCSLYYAGTQQEVIDAHLPGIGTDIQLKNCTYNSARYTSVLASDPYKDEKYPLSNCSSSSIPVTVTQETNVDLSNEASLSTEYGTSTATLSGRRTTEYGSSTATLSGRRTTEYGSSTATLSGRRTTGYGTSTATLSGRRTTEYGTSTATLSGRRTTGYETLTSTLSGQRTITSSLKLITSPLTIATGTNFGISNPFKTGPPLDFSMAKLTTTHPSTTASQGQTYSISSSTDVAESLSQEMLNEKEAASEASYHRCPPCQCPNDNQTEDEKVSFTNALLQKLTINTSQTSSSRRRKVSVQDDRKSAVGIGVLGGVFLSLPFVLIVSNDILTVIAYLQTL